MKIRNVALLAGASMALTMLSVWWMTPAGGFDGGLAERAELLGLAQAPDTTQVDAEAWKFETGSTLRVEGRLGHSTLSTLKDNETFVYLNVRAPADATATQAPPVDLAIVIDRSGSMAGKKMQNAINAAQGMVRRLRDGDRVSVVAFSDRAETLVSTTVIGFGNRESVIARIGEITPAGDTCISCAIDAGMSVLSGGFGTPSGGIKRMLLLSDGEPTAGVRDEQGFSQLALRARDMGCTISSVGVDVSYNQRIMSTIAFQSNGRHYFVEDAGSLSTIFDQELASLVRTVATDAEMRIAMAPGVEVVQVFDRSFRREGNTLVVPMGMFSASDEKTVLVKVRVPRGSSGDRPIASASLTFQDLVSGSAGSCTGDLLATLGKDTADLDPLVGARLGRTETAALLREANTLAQAGSLDEARAVISRKRADLQRQKVALAPRAKGRSAEVDGDFNRQLGALSDAEDGFASPAADPFSASPPRPQPAPQVRANEASATDMAF